MCILAVSRVVYGYIHNVIDGKPVEVETEQ